MISDDDDDDCGGGSGGKRKGKDGIMTSARYYLNTLLAQAVGQTICIFRLPLYHIQLLLSNLKASRYPIPHAAISYTGECCQGGSRFQTITVLLK